MTLQHGEAFKRLQVEIVRRVVAVRARSLEIEAGSWCALPDPESDRLTLAECRALLPPDLEISDAELERVRDEMYSLAEVALDAGRHLLPSLNKRAG